MAVTTETRIAVLSRSFSRHPVLRAELAALYPNVTFNDTGRTLVGAELVEFLRGHEAAVVALEAIGGPLFEALPGLRVVSKYGVGLDNVDLKAAAAHGVQVGWTGGVNRRSVAELALCFMIAGLRGVTTSQAEIRAGIWRQYLGRQISDATVGLIGCGHVGKELARMLRAIGVRVLAHDIRDISEFCAAHGVESVGLDALIAEADVVSLHVPSTPDTANMIDAGRLAAMRKGAVLVNTARGGLVDEAALKAALQSGQLSAALFDVFASEPPTDTELLGLPNFLATAHIGGSANEAVVAMGRAAIAGLAQATDPLTFLSPWAP
ncbi:phosphoglycerate dehydrogenase [Roseomonas sp. KE2513]|uniref:phosphoglycerate dehydrogenase n=1 Tax=Roseomonas sp. KE2513 TaxID=2479202 RepID=UPI0018E005C3|nr:phosphoglycerate dehydrogenase [Roseomonas sp. KE2513]MBI0534668.1 phosphoglycerate dehydrogenase [Roseomonas sp. KE2513]